MVVVKFDEFESICFKDSDVQNVWLSQSKDNLNLFDVKVILKNNKEYNYLNCLGLFDKM